MYRNTDILLPQLLEQLSTPSLFCKLTLLAEWKGTSWILDKFHKDKGAPRIRHSPKEFMPAFIKTQMNRWQGNPPTFTDKQTDVLERPNIVTTLCLISFVQICYSLERTYVTFQLPGSYFTWNTICNHGLWKLVFIPIIQGATLISLHRSFRQF